MKLSSVMKLMLILIIIGYVELMPINFYTNKLDALAVLLLSILILFKSKENLPLFLMFFFIFYCNYSITIGEYIISGSLSVPMTQVKNPEIYGITIRVVLVFMAIITLFFNSRKFDIKKDRLEPEEHVVAFYLTISAIIFVLLTGVNRGGSFTSYSVRITVFYEYGKLLFLFAYYFLGKSKIRKLIFVLLILIYVLQDFYYGGRVTSLQILTLFLVTLWCHKLTIKNIISYGFLGILLSSLVSAYRSSYSIEGIRIIGTLQSLISKVFVFDTATFAYYASATHIAAAQTINYSTRLSSLWSFLTSIFIGSRTSAVTADVTAYARELGFKNYGGGLIPTHFYFWMGWIGVVLIGIIVVYLLNTLKFEENTFHKIILISIIMNVPRWYLYSPNQLFRGALFVTAVLYISYKMLQKLTSKTKVCKATVNND
jgi:hypothetical protein